MPKNMNPDEVRNILERGNFDEFIGVVEDEQLECKSAPYQVQNDHEKQELAKDVSGHRSVQELHTLLRDGLQYDSLNQRLESLKEALQRLQMGQAQQEQAPQPDTLRLLSERIEQALIAAALQSKPTFILAAVPTQSVEMPTLFERRDADIVRLLEHPPQLREAGFGFGLDTGASARIVQGQLRRAVDSGYKILELWRDGTLIFGVTGDGDFLCWGSHVIGGGPLRINQLALIESTYLFAELSRQVFEQAQPRPSTIEYRLELRNMTIDGTPCSLIPGPLGTFAWKFGTNIHRAPDSSGTLIARWEEAEINSGAVAFLLVSRVYEWFGIDRDQIPYVERVDSRSGISPDLIRRGGL
ncbi:MAG: hypothetical protein HY731_13015 [Candidatus Tectomicrobia bacterium]|nr:hypothetical protein [Candidatus Tectomicrobia bacterium]